MRVRLGWVLIGSLLSCPSGLWAQTSGCDRLAVSGVAPGMTYDETRRRLGGEEALVTDEGTGGARKSAVAYRVNGSLVYVRFDRSLSARGAAQVEMVRAPLAQTLTSVAALVGRLGEPNVGGDNLVRGLDQGPAVWIDEKCDLVLTYHRRQESWWAGDVGEFLQLERLAAAKEGASPATAASAAFEAQAHEAGASGGVVFSVPPASGVAGGAADGAAAIDPAATSAAAAAASAAASASAPAPEPAGTAPDDQPAIRVQYVPPAYPSAARLLHTRGRVTLRVNVRADGTVADATAVEATPAGKGFEEAAVQAARQWRYLPAKRDAKPVDSEVQVTVEFR